MSTDLPGLANSDDVKTLQERVEMLEGLILKSHAEMVSQDSIHAEELEKINNKLDLVVQALHILDRIFK